MKYKKLGKDTEVKQPSCFKYTFVVQCKEYINHAESKIIQTTRIENDGGVFMKALESLNKDPKKFVSISLGDIDLDLL